jgi:hypothetical protein
LLGACAGSDDGAPERDAERSTTVTSAAAATTSTTSAAQALAAGQCPAVPPRAEPSEDRPRYRADLTVDPTTGSVSGPVEVAFTPDLPVDRLVLRLWANAPRSAAVGTAASVSSVAVDGLEASIDLPDPTTVVVPLDREVEAGETIDVSLVLTLDVDGPARERVSRNGDSLRLGSFLPLLPWEPGRGWAVDPPTRLFAEAATTPTADFDVGLAVPADYDVLATGIPDGRGRWRAEAVRDFAASIGHLELASTVVDAPAPVEVTVGVQAGIDESPDAYLARVSDALVQFSQRFGPYPWPSLSVAITPGLDGGIEMPMHIMQGPETIGRTTPHEVAHMWFYSLVGNNQGRDPWMDEGLSTYAEATFEDTLDDFQAEPLPASGEGALGAPLAYWADFADDYYRVVYGRGATSVAELGPRELVDCALRHYVADQAYGVSTPDDLVDALAFVFPDAPAALAAAGVPPTN